MLSDETEPKARTTPVTMPPELRARFEQQREIDSRSVHAEILILLDEAIRAREKRK